MPFGQPLTAGLGGKNIIMGSVEQLHKHFNDQDSVSDGEVSQRLDDIKQEIRREWESYKHSRLYLHGEKIADSRLDMLLIYLIQRGVL